MLFWGPPTKFSSDWSSNQTKSKLRVIDDGRTAERLLNWINKQIGRYEVSSFIAYLIHIILIIQSGAFLKLWNSKGNYE